MAKRDRAEELKQAQRDKAKTGKRGEGSYSDRIKYDPMDSYSTWERVTKPQAVQKRA